ncbi:tetratricopeptide repeat protein [Flavihumibacter sp. UBA7668]|uniref:tetratricopeptide repeat protein n=1 Tax=Flavihumibacter sp. UBA7668 TaxID=1946542 RepID=UPI0025C61BF9|nr:tetratricopeptide repeat protein [Flavihumibacter sp. UBA7668]
MSIFKRLFSTKTAGQSNGQSYFSEGDIFYTHFDNQYHIYKLLVFVIDLECYHVLGYKPLDTLPSTKNIDSLTVAVYHSPIDKNGFKNAKLLTNDKISSKDLIGYHEYLRQMKEPNYYIPIANEYYQAGLRLTEEKRHYDAIDSYSKAVDLMPDFFEAIDNRAFCKMDLGQWAGAIEDFQESLEVNPNSLLAEFSIGECYLKMDNYQKAKEQFEKAIAIDQTHQAPKDFLKKVNELLGTS